MAPIGIELLGDERRPPRRGHRPLGLRPLLSCPRLRIRADGHVESVAIVTDRRSDGPFQMGTNSRKVVF